MRDERGFTLIEIMLALVVLVAAVVGLGTATGRFMHQVAESDVQLAAIQLADDRIETVLMDPDYGGLDTAYVGTENSFPGLSGFTRVTAITLVGGAGLATNHKNVVVTVDGPGLKQPIKRSGTVAAP